MPILRRWSARHARALERLCRLLPSLLAACGPPVRARGCARVEEALLPLQRKLKRLMFDCRRCGKSRLSLPP